MKIKESKGSAWRKSWAYPPNGLVVPSPYHVTTSKIWVTTSTPGNGLYAHLSLCLCNLAHTLTMHVSFSHWNPKYYRRFNHLQENHLTRNWGNIKRQNKPIKTKLTKNTMQNEDIIWMKKEKKMNSLLQILLIYKIYGIHYFDFSKRTLSFQMYSITSQNRSTKY